MKHFIFCIVLLVMAACSGESESDVEIETTSGTGEHVWKSQTDTLDKAAEVEGLIMDSAEQTREAIDSNF